MEAGSVGETGFPCSKRALRGFYFLVVGAGSKRCAYQKKESIKDCYFFQWQCAYKRGASNEIRDWQHSCGLQEREKKTNLPFCLICLFVFQNTKRQICNYIRKGNLPFCVLIHNNNKAISLNH